MATQAFTVDKPAAGVDKTIAFETNDSIGFSFTADDIQALQLTEGGALIISFSDDSSLIIVNFTDLAREGMSITLADDTAFDFQQVYEGVTGSSIASIPTVITAPDADTTATIQLEEGKNYKFVFDTESPDSISHENGVLIISFKDGRLVLESFDEAMASDNPPAFIMDGQYLSLEELLDTLQLASAMSDNMDTPDTYTPVQTPATMEDVRTTGGDDMAALARQLSEIEPAAGDQGSNSARGGFGFQSNVDNAPLGAPDAIGPIGPTELLFGLPQTQDDLMFVDDPQTPPPGAPSIEVGDYRVLEDGSVQICVDVNGNEESGVQTIVTISGVPAGWGVDENGGHYDAQTGTWTITIPGDSVFCGGPLLSPPADSDADLAALQVTAVNEDPATGKTSSAFAVFDVIVDAVADTPSLSASGSTGDEDTSLPLTINTGVSDTDGSESITKVVISGVPEGFTLSNGADLGGGEWQLSQADLSGLTISAPENYSGSINPGVTVFAEESNKTDSDFDLTNDTAQAQTTLSVTWEPVADAPGLDVADAQVKEDGSVFIPVEASLVDTDGSEYLTVTVSGVPSDWDLSGAGWSAAGNDGEFSVTLPAGEDYSGGFTLTPPADSDVDLSGLEITATSTESANSDAAQTTKTIDVTVDAVADEPSIEAENGSGNEDTALAVDLTGYLSDTDGSEAIIKYQISGVPEGFSFNKGADLGGGTWEFTPADLVGLTMSAPENYFGAIELSATIFTSEDPATDGEFDGSDNDNQASTGFTMEWKPVADTPFIEANNGADDALVKEDGSVFVPITASLNPADSENAYLTITVSGINPDWNVEFSEGSLDGDTWTLTLPAGTGYNGGLTFYPPADSDLDLSGLTATATATEPATDTSAAADDGFNIITDAVADEPGLQVQEAIGLEDQPLPLNIGTMVTDLDGSEEITAVVISGLPEGATLSAGFEVEPGVWVLGPEMLPGLHLFPAADYFGDFSLTVTSYSEEVILSGGEFDFTDNTALAQAELSVEILPVADTPFIEANNGADDALVKEDGSVFVPITASLNPADSENAYLTITVSGINPDWNVEFSEGSLDGDTWTLTLPAGTGYNGGLTFYPPADSDLDLSGLTATATATEPATDTSAAADDGFNIITDAVADEPELNVTGASGEEGTWIALDIGTNVSDIDGSEEITAVVISGLPENTGLNAGFEASAGTWVLSTSDLAGLEIFVADGVTGAFDLTVASYSEEINLSGGEFDYTDNTAFAETILTLTVYPDDEPQIIQPDDAVVDETDLSGGNVVYLDTLQADFGSDTPGSFAATGSFSTEGSLPGGSLTSSGVAVTVSLVGNTYYGKAGAETVFTLSIDPDSGEYEFTLLGNLDHADDADPDDVISLSFGFSATDSDNDTDESGVITVQVHDDALAIENVENLVIPNQEGPYEGTITLDDSADGLQGYALSALNGEVPDGLIYTTYSFGDILPQAFLDAGITAPAQGGSLLVAELEKTDGGTELFFALSLDADGQYVFDLINENPIIEKDVDLGTIPPGNYPDGIYYDADTKGWSENYSDAADVYIHGSGSVNPSGAGIGISNNQFEINETIIFEFSTDVATASVATVRQSGNSNWQLEVQWYAYDGGVDGTLVDQGTVVFSGAAGLYDFSTNLGIQFDTLVLVGLNESQSDITNNNAKYTLAELSYSEAFLPQELDLAFDVTATDGDYDADSASLYVTIGGGNGSAYSLSGDNNPDYGDDALYGAGTGDTFYGGDGADRFVFSAINDNVDTIADFDSGEGDVIDMTALLGNYDPVQDAINDFVFARVENGDTIISVDAGGSGAAESAQDVVVLDNVTDFDFEAILTSSAVNVA